MWCISVFLDAHIFKKILFVFIYLFFWLEGANFFHNNNY